MVVLWSITSVQHLVLNHVRLLGEGFSTGGALVRFHAFADLGINGGMICTLPDHLRMLYQIEQSSTRVEARCTKTEKRWSNGRAHAFVDELGSSVSEKRAEKRKREKTTDQWHKNAIIN